MLCDLLRRAQSRIQVALLVLESRPFGFSVQDFPTAPLRPTMSQPRVLGRPMSAPPRPYDAFPSTFGEQKSSPRDSAASYSFVRTDASRMPAGFSPRWQTQDGQMEIADQQYLGEAFQAHKMYAGCTRGACAAPAQSFCAIYSDSQHVLSLVCHTTFYEGRTRPTQESTSRVSQWALRSPHATRRRRHSLSAPHRSAHARTPSPASSPTSVTPPCPRPTPLESRRAILRADVCVCVLCSCGGQRFAHIERDQRKRATPGPGFYRS